MEIANTYAYKAARKIKRLIISIVHYFTIREKKESWGNEYPDRTFYIIRIDFPMAGLFAIVKSYLSHVEYALDRGYIPVIDMKNCKSQFLKDVKGGGNPWLIFYKQPYIELDEIAKAKNIIISKNIQCPNDKYVIGVDVLHDNMKERLKYHTLHYRKNFILADAASDYVEKKYATIIGNKKNVLGVICRGTDYLYKRPAGHPVQPYPDQVIEKIHIMESEFAIDWIYIATEDTEILKLFIKMFGHKLLYINQKRFHNEAERFISDYHFKNDERITMNLDYLSSMYILSKCDYLIGGRTSGTIAANLMSDSFKYHYYWDLGSYPVR